MAQHRVQALLRVIDAFSFEILTVDRELRSAVSDDDRVRRLVAIPGVGPHTAATVVAEVWDVHRFRGPEQLACWAGLTPRERSSADHVRRGHISKQGSRWLRWVLVEASIRACKDEKLRDFYKGPAGLLDEPRCGAPRRITDQQVEEVVVKTLESTPLRRSASAISRPWRW